jgi:hypothetical protein
VKTNLTYKNIRDFQPGDSIYLHLPSERGMSKITALCEFISFEKGLVEGKVIEIETNASIYKQKIKEGWTPTVNLRNCSLWGQSPGENHPIHHWFDPIGHAAYKTAEERHMGVPKEHPSYGMISITHEHSSRPEACFGSPILHRHPIALKISQASLERELHEDRYHANKAIIEVEMTPQQFADMLTSPNTGGTPVTIKSLQGEMMEECPFVSKLEQFETELKERVKTTFAETKRKLNTITEMLEGTKPPGKKDKEHIKTLIDSISQSVEANFPFIQTQMIEEMGKVVGEAKASITAFLQEQVKAQGLPSHTHMPILLEAPQPKEAHDKQS